MSTRVASRERRGVARRWLAFGVGALAVLLGLGLAVSGGAQRPLQPAFAQGGVETLLVLAVPAYVAGVFSLLSPCCLPILPAYFSFTFTQGVPGAAPSRRRDVDRFLPRPRYHDGRARRKLYGAQRAHFSVP